MATAAKILHAGQLASTTWGEGVRHFSWLIRAKHVCICLCTIRHVWVHSGPSKTCLVPAVPPEHSAYDVTSLKNLGHGGLTVKIPKRMIQQLGRRKSCYAAKRVLSLSPVSIELRHAFNRFRIRTMEGQRNPFTAEGWSARVLARGWARQCGDIEPV
ncbi:hypothetical protein F5Y12DRAFT_135050 [Xylaria sp. FL1777]|nr:hypothetical protein F5Y12DRAFT_135050 [Xylaria sp. FL1777]